MQKENKIETGSLITVITKTGKRYCGVFVRISLGDNRKHPEQVSITLVQEGEQAINFGTKMFFLHRIQRIVVGNRYVLQNILK